MDLYTVVPSPARETVEILHSEDLALARAVLAGSADAWHTFIRRYSRLIMAVIRRYVGNRGDEARSVHADVLESLYRGGLARYAGRAALSTWLVAVTRAAVVDDVRRRLGGRRLRARLKGLEPYEREVFRLYYMEGLSFGTVLRMARDQGAQATPDRLLLALQRIENRVTDRFARRLRYDLHAQSVGAASGRLLEYLDHFRSEAEDGEGYQSPECRMVEREARLLLDEVATVVAQLPAEERRLLSLRFEQGWTAGRIAEELGLGGQRSVYTRIDRILRGLRKVLGPLKP
ncbi:MAG: RNA polymerase sigma factor [Candidatus Eiseniibacteriota bacterium]